jgi:hypothetical protein
MFERLFGAVPKVHVFDGDFGLVTQAVVRQRTEVNLI